MDYLRPYIMPVFSYLIYYVADALAKLHILQHILQLVEWVFNLLKSRVGETSRIINELKLFNKYLKPILITCALLV